ncbi:MAG: serine protease [Treponema sp.]|jgi:serine protease Do|nr:serine protease [Treponema sp.]
MTRRFFIFLALIFVVPVCVFSQQQNASAAALRDYVGVLNQSYHPGIVAYFEKVKADLEKQGESSAVKAIDIFLGGSFGSGFIYSDSGGNLYVITNNHVVAQAHTLSITFERQDGFKKKIENLRIIAADEETDLAILAFPAGEKPVAQGLSFLARAIEEGEDIYSAGFPGLGITPIWQFGRGTVSNAAVRFPKSLDDSTMMGPYIQHTAQVDPGNSGGPLLAAQRNVPTGYAVAGINTLSALRRQAANYAIPVATARAFIDNALNQKPETYRAALDQRLAKFTEGLGANRAVYPHIAEYLSSDCIGENAEYAMMEMFEKGSRTVRRAFIDKCEDSVVGAMGYAVAWTIENSIRGGGVIRAAVKETTGEGEEYTVVFAINDKDVSSKWVREYGNWRIRSFGTVAAGDKSLVEKREAQKKEPSKLRLNSNIHLEAGYATLFGKAPAAFYASAEFLRFFGAKAYVAGPGFWSIGAFGGYRWDIPAGKFGFMPYIRAGLEFQYDQEYEDFKETHWGVSPLAVSLAGQAGLKVTSSFVPGLFLGLAFQYNLLNFHSLFDSGSQKYGNPMKMGLAVTAGYAF